MTVGTESQPLRVAIFGSGPAAFYAAEYLFKQKQFAIEVDMFDRLPVPFGLVRYGVAPDHLKIKQVTKVFENIAANPRYRFFGNVEFGKDVLLAELKDYYHQIFFATGAQSDRHMGIPGEDLKGSDAATEFVGWYNGHPDYRDRQWNLNVASAAVVGVGNVAIDVARLLCLTREELWASDAADYAVEALSHSQIKTVYLLGRRGPAQAAFTNPEIKEVGDLDEADITTRADEMQLDELSAASIADDRVSKAKVEILQSFAVDHPLTKPRRLNLRFLVSPVELFGDADGNVTRMKLVRNILVASEAGSLRPQTTDQFEEIDTGLVFRSVGYRGKPLLDVPFNDRWGVILNEKGRVIDPESKHPIVGLYTSGWIKRGPSGVVGTNKPDSVESVTCMLEDFSTGSILQPSHADAASAEKFIGSRNPDYFSWADWKCLDALELERGQACGRPRVKFTSVEEMKKAVGK
jgi:ferredoxin/flavodoxin---NADP+ reductase